MSSRASERVIRWVFVIASITGIWQLELPRFLDKVARAAGASPGTLLYSIIVDGGLSIMLVLLAQFVLLIHDKALWPLCSKNYRGGWWIYSLVARTIEGPVSIAGIFYLMHTPNEAYVINGRAFYLDKGMLSYRADWESDAVLISDLRIRMLFHVRAVNPPREPPPSHYDSYLELKQVRGRTADARSRWHGYFEDLGDRAMVSGPVYAEHLRRKVLRDQMSIEEVLKREATRLYEQVSMRISELPRQG